MKQTMLTVAICLAFTLINFGIRVKATDPTILDISSFDGDVVTIGNSDCNIQLDLAANLSTLKCRKLHVVGIDANGMQAETQIDSQKITVGDVDNEFTHTLVDIDGLNGVVAIITPTPIP